MKHDADQNVRTVTCLGNSWELTKCNKEIQQSKFGSDVDIEFWAPWRCAACRRRSVEQTNLIGGAE